MGLSVLNRELSGPILDSYRKRACHLISVVSRLSGLIVSEYTVASETDDSTAPLFTPRRKRRMTRAHAVLWTLILASTMADIVLTMAGLELGLQEGNVLVHVMVSQLGIAGLRLVKFLAMCWLVAGWALLSDRNATIFLGLFATVTSAVVVNNAVLVLG